MIEPTSADIGRSVIYRGRHSNNAGEGVITSFDDWYVFVRFSQTSTSEAISRDDLSWSPSSQPEEDDISSRPSQISNEIQGDL